MLYFTSFPNENHNPLFRKCPQSISTLRTLLSKDLFIRIKKAFGYTERIKVFGQIL